MEQAGEGEELFPEGEAEARAGALERLGRKIRTGSRMIREKGIGSAADYLRERRRENRTGRKKGAERK